MKRIQVKTVFGMPISFPDLDAKVNKALKELQDENKEFRFIGINNQITDHFGAATIIYEQEVNEIKESSSPE